MTTTTKQPPTSLEQAIQRASSLAAQIDEPLLAQQLDTLCAEYTSQKLRVLFFGEFSRGKSTLINALLGRVVLPARLIPTNGHVISVIFGEQEQVHLLRSGQPVESHPLAMLDAVASLQPDGSGREDIGEIIVTVNHPLLRRPITLLDTPGMNDDATRHARTEQAILRADLVVFVLDARVLLGEYERTLAIDWLQKAWGKPILPVVNFMHMVPANEQNDIRRRMATWCAHHLHARFTPSWLEVDALVALKHAHGAAPAPIDDFAQLQSLLFEMDVVDPTLRARLQRHSRSSALRAALEELNARNAATLMVVQQEAAKAAAQFTESRRKREEELSLLEANIEHIQQTVANDANSLLDAALQKLLDKFKGKDKAALDKSATQSYQTQIRKSFGEVEELLYTHLAALGIDGIDYASSIALREHVTFDTRIYVAQLAKVNADGETVGAGVIWGAVIGSFFAPGAGTAVGGAIGGGLAAMFGGSEGDPVAAYQAAARSAWAKDAAQIQRLVQEEFATASAMLVSSAEERLAKTLAEASSHQKESATLEIEQRTVLAQAIATCKAYLQEPSA